MDNETLLEIARIKKKHQMRLRFLQSSMSPETQKKQLSANVTGDISLSFEQLAQLYAIESPAMDELPQSIVSMPIPTRPEPQYSTSHSYSSYRSTPSYPTYTAHHPDPRSPPRVPVRPHMARPTPAPTTSLPGPIGSAAQEPAPTLFEPDKKVSPRAQDRGVRRPTARDAGSTSYRSPVGRPMSLDSPVPRHLHSREPLRERGAM